MLFQIDKNVPGVKLVGITKRFPGVLANDRIDFEVRPGEIHALLGENGAGKSTLMSILAGLYQPDEGEIYLRGQKVKLRGPSDAIAQGIGLVYQHFKLVPNQTVAENVALGMKKPLFVLRLKQIEQDLQNLGEKHKLPVKPQALVETLSVGEQQRAEILRVLYLGATILAFDEPTANLTPQETEGLFAALRRLAAENYAIIFISHKLEEVTSLANRATILRGGRAVATLDLEGEPGEKEQIARLMIGREADEISKSELGLSTKAKPQQNVAPKSPQAGPVLKVIDLKVKGNELSTTLKGVSFEVYPGEIVGLVGVAGNGQRELAESLSGLQVIQSGSIQLNKTELNRLDVRSISKLGVAFVPEDRLGLGLAPGLNLEDNFILRDYWRKDYSSGPFLRPNIAGQRVAEAIEDYSIAVGDAYAPARLLSGGNLQKLLLARELATNPKLLIVANPTRGLDVGASAYVHRKLLDVRENGAGVLLIVEDLDEALLLCDRLLVMYEGRLTGEVPPLRTPQNLERIGLMMAGADGEGQK